MQSNLVILTNLFTNSYTQGNALKCKFRSYFVCPLKNFCLPFSNIILCLGSCLPSDSFLRIRINYTSINILVYQGHVIFAL